MGVKLYRTSVKTNLLVDDVFDYVADAFIKSGGETQQDIEPVPGGCAGCAWCMYIELVRLLDMQLHI